MPDCFVIMPISTPESLALTYADDKDHFKHVLDHLFAPAIEKADFTPVSPIAKGADLIHAEIIKKIETADLVLCDMSTLNANVFFELGIRTAVDKPVCIVKDDRTLKVPFDAVIINYHEYASSLAPWTLAKQVEELAAHIKSSAGGLGGHNPLWKYFGLSSRAELERGKPTAKDSVELLALEIAALKRMIEDKEFSGFRRHSSAGDIMLERASALGIPVKGMIQAGDAVTLRTTEPAGHWPVGAYDAILDLAHELGIPLSFQTIG